MSWQATEAVMHTSRATGSKRLVLMVLATFADEQGEAWPSTERVAPLAGLEERQTRTTLQALVSAGELIILRPGGGRQTTTKYLLPHLEWMETLQSSADTLRSTAPLRSPNRGQFGPERVRSSVERVQFSEERVQFSADTLRSTAPEPRTIEPSIEPSLKEAQKIAAPVFEQVPEIVSEPSTSAPASGSVPATIPASAQPDAATAPEKVSPRRRAAPAELPEMPADLAALPGLPDAWDEWLTYRRERRLATAPSTARGMFVKLQQFQRDGQDPVEVIRNSIANGWQGLFPVKGQVLKFQLHPQTTKQANEKFVAGFQKNVNAVQGVF